MCPMLNHLSEVIKVFLWTGTGIWKPLFKFKANFFTFHSRA